MEIISHRGYWFKNSEKNSDLAFRRSFSLSFGTETDIRDFDGELVISHDVANKNCITIEKFFEIYKSIEIQPSLALNIKSDGLQNLLKKSLKQNNINNYFVFDMSIPDTIMYLKEGMNVFIRQSEHELGTSFYESASGIWLDAFDGVWYSEELVKKHLNNGKKVAIVSSELHNREYLKHWTLLKSWNIINDDNLILCTDFPEKAIKFFKNE
jgi:glycerophosphoryl diester phosphodiesterase